MRFSNAFAALLLVGTAACRVSTTPENEADGQPTQSQAPLDPAAQQRELARLQAQQELRDLRVLVDISDRKLQLLQGERVIRTEDVSVGTKEWPTPTGKWDIHRVDINPEWIPPKDEEWAESREPQPPGSPDNPMGKARLLYRSPNSIHGTSDLASLGKAASHGSIRVSNAVVLQLAEMLLRAGGSWEGRQWFDRMVQMPTKEFAIDVREPVPIEVRE